MIEAYQAPLILSFVAAKRRFLYMDVFGINIPDAAKRIGQKAGRNSGFPSWIGIGNVTCRPSKRWPNWAGISW